MQHAQETPNSPDQAEVDHEAFFTLTWHKVEWASAHGAQATRLLCSTHSQLHLDISLKQVTADPICFLEYLTEQKTQFLYLGPALCVAALTPTTSLQLKCRL